MRASRRRATVSTAGRAAGRGIVAGILFAVLVTGAVPAARAHGGKLQLGKVSIGSYRVSVWTQPSPARVGRLDVSVSVMRPPSDEPVLDARVRLRAQHGERLELAGTSDLQPGDWWIPLYHAEIDLPASGSWHLSVAVDGPGGAGEAGFDLPVLPPRPLAWTVAWVVGGVLALGAWLAARARWRGRAGGEPGHR